MTGGPRTTDRRRLLRSRSGSAALEFALVAIPFCMLSLGIFEIGRLMWTNEALEETAATGARCMGVLAASCAASGSYPTAFSSTNTTNYIVGVAADWNVTLSATNVAVNQNASCGTVTGFSQVTITYTFETLLPSLLTSLASGPTWTVQACFPNQT